MNTIYLQAKKVHDFLSASVHMFYPETCLGCGKAGNFKGLEICIPCRMSLPRTNSHLHLENPIERIFYGRANLGFANAFLHYNKGGMVKSLLHELKYGNRPSIGMNLGKLYALEFSQVENRIFEDSVLVPIPLHSEKLARRGYNQSEEIAKGISEIFNLKIDSKLLKRNHNNSSQTSMNRIQRMQNSQELFELNDFQVEIPSKIVLVDDVITTGATIESCANALQSNYPDVSIGVMAIAYSD